MTPGLGYSLTAYETNGPEIRNAIRTFDDAFSAAARLADGVQRILHLESRAEYARIVLSERLGSAGLNLHLE